MVNAEKSVQAVSCKEQLEFTTKVPITALTDAVQNEILAKLAERLRNDVFGRKFRSEITRQ